MAETPEEAERRLPQHPTRDAILRALRAQYVAALEKAAGVADDYDAPECAAEIRALAEQAKREGT